jgi:hypothetical protein
MRIWRALVTAFLIGVSLGFSFVARADLATSFPDPAAIATEFEAFRALDLASPDVAFTRSKGGTSAYAVLNVGDRAVGAFLPPNSATAIDGEAGAYRLARILGVAESVQPAVLSSLQDEGLTKLRALFAQDPRTGAPAENIRKILARMDAQPGAPLPGVLKYWNNRPYDFDEVVRSGGLNPSSPFAQWIRSDGPQPSEKLVTRTAGKKSGIATERALARELSTHLLIDALLGQWDRFSGGNLQIYVSSAGELHFALFDNGGTWGGASYTQKTLRQVSRFDREAVARLREMQSFLAGRGEFYGAKNESELRAFLQLTTSDGHWKTFKRNLGLVLAAIDAVPESTAKYF